MNMNIYAYKSNSHAAKVLAEAMGIQRIKHTMSRFRGRPNKIVINWGAYEVPDQVSKCDIINKPVDILLASNKLSFFNILEGTDLTPLHTTDRHVADEWLAVGHKVVARTLLNASGGRGIVLLLPDQDTIAALLYVRYQSKMEEYRVHMLGIDIIHLQQKKRRLNHEGPNWQIRNHANGFIYAMKDITPPSCVIKVARECWKLFDLDFGAIDIIYNKKNDKAWALEINTAPGLEGQTVDIYAHMLKQYLA